MMSIIPLPSHPFPLTRPAISDTCTTCKAWWRGSAAHTWHNVHRKSFFCFVLVPPSGLCLSPKPIAMLPASRYTEQFWRYKVHGPAVTISSASSTILPGPSSSTLGLGPIGHLVNDTNEMKWKNKWNKWFLEVQSFCYDSAVMLSHSVKVAMETSTMETITSSLAEPPHSPGRVTGFFLDWLTAFWTRSSPQGGGQNPFKWPGKIFFHVCAHFHWIPIPKCRPPPPGVVTDWFFGGRKWVTSFWKSENWSPLRAQCMPQSPCGSMLYNAPH